MADPITKSGVVMFANSEHGLEIAKPLVDEANGYDAVRTGRTPRGLRERPLERDGQECGRLAFF